MLDYSICIIKLVLFKITLKQYLIQGLPINKRSVPNTEVRHHYHNIIAKSCSIALFKLLQLYPKTKHILIMKQDNKKQSLRRKTNSQDQPVRIEEYNSLQASHQQGKVCPWPATLEYKKKELLVVGWLQDRVAYLVSDLNSQR